jgi:hypothetical protein
MGVTSRPPPAGSGRTAGAALLAAAGLGWPGWLAGRWQGRFAPKANLGQEDRRRGLALVAGGRSNQEIAAELFVAKATFETHINRIFARTGSRDRAQAAACAFPQGLAR